MQQTGIEGKELILLIEDHQLVDATFLELINSLLSAGEVPGLYTAEELEPLLTPLRDLMSLDAHRGTPYSYFSQRVKRHLHVVLIMDSAADGFSINCQANPALYTHCSFQSMEGWSEHSMVLIPQLVLSGVAGIKALRKADTTQHQRPMMGGEDLAHAFLHIHKSCGASVGGGGGGGGGGWGGSTPRQYITLLRTYQLVYSSKKQGVAKRQAHLQAGVSKLNDARALVDELKRKAGVQRALLAEKQAEADVALKEITASMQSASEQKSEIEVVKQQQSEELAKLEKRKKAIVIELSEIEPLVQEAMKAVGNIKPETLSEIRALRAPPDVIRDILEGVLRIMGVYDTSWGSMRNFLARRGIKEEIQSFDARKINPTIRESVNELLTKNEKSFDPAVAKRASQVALPLASWVKANIKYSYVLERIQPLEAEQAQLQENLDRSNAKLEKLGKQLETLEKRVLEMRDTFEKRTTEAARVRIEVEKEEETITAAQNLIGKLEGEHKRWSGQVGELAREMELLTKRSLIAAGFITYLSKAPEDERRQKLGEWLDKVGLDAQTFSVRRFLSTESEQLIWKGEGLPSDDLSMENALVILHSQQTPLLIDPSQRATEWLKVHLKESRLEVINQQDSNFTTALELAVRFGKTLIIQEVDGVEPLLYPLMRKDLASQGPRSVVQLGDKSIEYNESFRLFLSMRNPQPEIPPDAASIITRVNFTTTRAGLTAQLLASTLQSEKPELEERKATLLKSEEDLKVQLAALEESLLQELAMAEGNILENKALLESLNQTKVKSTTISSSLEESMQLQRSLDQERDSYLPLATYGSTLFFVIADLSKINNMYRFSLSSFLRLFVKALQNKQDTGNTELRIRTLMMTLQSLIYEHVCRSLFKADRLMFAMHLVHAMHPQLFQQNEWELFTGQVVADKQEKAKQTKDSVPTWCDQERAQAVLQIKSSFPTLYANLDFNSVDTWKGFARSSECEKEFPPGVAKRMTPFQEVLIIQAVRPDRLQTAMEHFAMRALNLKELSPSTLNLKKLYQTESTETEPVLIVISPGVDPSQELQELAESTVGGDRYHQVAMGQGQADIALQLLRESAVKGDWLCLKNLHLVTAWLPVLEKELNSLEPSKGFRLWLTTELHPKFPAILLQSSMKVTYEAPPGIKKNLERTYDMWSPELVSQGNLVVRSQTLFALAWFHAVVQERRCYIPQGWSKFYEFTQADLRVAQSIVDRLMAKAGKPQWDFMCGLMESAVYGGRVDNNFDCRVLASYLKQYFNDTVISGQVSSTAGRGVYFVVRESGLLYIVVRGSSLLYIVVRGGAVYCIL